MNSWYRVPLVCLVLSTMVVLTVGHLTGWMYESAPCISNWGGIHEFSADRPSGTVDIWVIVRDVCDPRYGEMPWVEDPLRLYIYRDGDLIREQWTYSKILD